MRIDKQKPIKFINDCDCIVDEAELKKAILWCQQAPTAKIKHIFMFGAYPAISIHGKKHHVHRLLMLYWHNGIIPHDKQVHHKNGNKKDASRANLVWINQGVHQSMHNKGKAVTQATKNAIIRLNHSRKGGRMKNRRQDVTPQMVFQYHKQGMSFNQISKLTGLDWGCVKQRYIDAINNNPELLKTTI